MLPKLHLFTVLVKDLLTLLVRAATSDSRNVRVIQFAPLLAKTFSRRLNLRLPAAINTRPRLAQDKTFLRRSEPTAPGRGQHKTTRLSVPFLRRSKPTVPRPRHTQTNLKIPRPLLLKPCDRDSRIFYQWATPSSAGTLFLPPRFSKVLEHSRRFYPGLAQPIARSSFPSASY
jgi:hypothetical protein